MDIKISLEIGLSPALEGFLTKVLGGPDTPKGDVRPGDYRTTIQTTDTGALKEREALIAEGEEAMQDRRPGPYTTGENQQDPQPEAQRRTRRTKAQIEADNAAATDLKTESAETTEEAGSADVEPPASDLAAALGAEQPEARAGVTAKADVAAKMQEAMAAASPKKVQEKMIEHLNGAKNLSGLDPALYGKAVELFDSIIAGA